MIEVTYSDVNNTQPDDKVVLPALPTDKTRPYWKGRAWQIVRIEMHTDDEGFTNTVVKLA